MSEEKRFVKITCDDIVRNMVVRNPITGEKIPGICDVSIRFRGDDGEWLVVPEATVKMYMRVDVLAAAKFLPLEWPIDAAKMGVLP